VKKTKRKTRKERQRLYDNRLPVKDTKSRPKSAEQIKPNKAILEVPRTVPNNRQAPIRRQLPQETEKSVAIKKHTARHLVPLVPKDATLVHFTEKEGCNIDEDSILEALIAKIARIKFENEAKEAWTTNRNGIFWHSDSKKVSKKHENFEKFRNQFKLSTQSK